MVRRYKKKNRQAQGAKTTKRGRAAPAQMASYGFSQRAHVFNRYPLFPRQLQFSSNWNRTIEVDLSGGQFQWTIGLFDYLSYIPEYALECYQLYRFSRITGVDVTLTVVGESDEANQNFAYEAAMAKIPFNQIGLTPSALKLVRGSRYSLNPTAGMNKTVLKESFGSFDELGNPVLDRQFWQNFTEATAVTPADPDRPVVGIAVRVVNGNRGIVSVNVSATYHMQFFELEWNRIPELELRRADFNEDLMKDLKKELKKDLKNERCLDKSVLEVRLPPRTSARPQSDDSEFAEMSDKLAPRRR